MAKKAGAPRSWQFPRMGLLGLSGWFRIRGTREPCAHQVYIGDDCGSGLAFCVAGDENDIPVEIIPVVFDQAQAQARRMSTPMLHAFMNIRRMWTRSPVMKGGGAGSAGLPSFRCMDIVPNPSETFSWLGVLPSWCQYPSAA